MYLVSYQTKNHIIISEKKSQVIRAVNVFFELKKQGLRRGWEKRCSSRESGPRQVREKNGSREPSKKPEYIYRGRVENRLTDYYY